MNILITGGSGFIGKNLINHLSLKNNNIYYCDNQNFSTDLDYVGKGNITKICNDISEISRDTLRNIDTLIHLAAIKKHNSKDFDGDRELIRTNVFETARIFQLAKETKIGHIIFSSSLYAHGDMHKLNALESDYPAPITLYGSSKLFGENLLREVALNSDINCVAMRFYFIYGPMQYSGKGYPSVLIRNMERMSLGFNPIIVNDGNQALDYLYVDDLCNFFEKIIAKPKKGFTVVNASSGLAVSINILVRRLTEIWNSKHATNFIVKYSGTDFTKGSFRSGSRDLASRLWRWQPTTSIDSGLQKLIDWYNEVHKI